MAVFRVERNKGYTVMSNHHLRNKELSKPPHGKQSLKLLILNAPYLLFVYLFDKVGAAVRLIIYVKGKNAKKYRKGI